MNKIKFSCEKKDVDSGQFSIEQLKEFSIKPEIEIVIIPGLAVIQDGKLIFWETYFSNRMVN